MARKGENIFKRKDGRWDARIITGHDASGKAIYRYIYAHSYSEAKNRKNEFIQNKILNEENKREKNNVHLISDIVCEYLNFKKSQVKESTYTRYYGISTNHILPTFGSHDINDLITADINEFIISKRTCGKKDGNGGLSEKTISDIICVLKQLICYAVSQGYRIEPLQFPSQHVYHEKAKTLSVDDEEKLINFAINKGSPQSFGVIVSLFTGIRIGELCALRWSDVDLSNKTIRICKTIQRIPNISGQETNRTKIILDKPKTNNSIRLIPIPSFLYSHFLKIKQSSDHPDSYLLTGTSKFVEPSNYYTMYQRWLRDCNIQGYSFHSLRHTFATRCIEKGIDPKVLSELLGHANISITLSLYVHPSMSHKRQSIDLLSELISSQNIGLSSN